ncbi:carbonyl reductase [Xylariales sp. PMI_506]|nr:carbonyl reductase [Xylariales sp. PMI_506]
MATPTPASTSTIVFITGANSGIGYEVVRRLSTPSLYTGYHVIIGCLAASDGVDAVTKLTREDPSRSLSSVEIDVTSDDSVAAAVAHIEREFGRLDVLINNAGVLLDGLDTTEVPRQLLEKTFSVNVFGAAAVTEAMAPLLDKSTSPSPRIVFMSSRLGSLAVKTDAADRSAVRHFPVYRSSKCALNMLMLHYAAIFKAKGWKVNSCDPGLTATSLAGNQKNMGTVEDGAKNCLRLATLGVDGETGSFTNKEGPIPW